MSRLLLRPLLSLVALSALTACEQPPVRATSDDRQHRNVTRIEGDLVVTGRTRGHALVLLYDATRPPPPEGTGRPLAFTFIPAEEIFGAALADTTHVGPFTAPYTLSQVPPGKYLVRGFIDAWGGGGTAALANRIPDFNPWFGVTSDTNKGDLGGAAVVVGTYPTKLREIVVPQPVDDETPLEPITGVTVVFQESTSTVVPADRPAFQVTGSATWTATAPTLLTLTASPLYGGGVDQRAPAFFARYIDADGNGVPDAPGGIPQVWPKVIVRKLADSDPAMLTDENDLDRNGILDTTIGFRDYPHLAEPTPAPADGQPDLVVLAAGWEPTSLAAALNDSQGNPLMDTPDPITGAPRFRTVPLASMTLAIRPAALDASNPAAPAMLTQVPKGKYAIIVMQLTGQSWRVPNELNPALHAITGLPEVTSQAFVLTVQ